MCKRKEVLLFDSLTDLYVCFMVIVLLPCYYCNTLLTFSFCLLCFCSTMVSLFFPHKFLVNNIASSDVIFNRFICRIQFIGF